MLEEINHLALIGGLMQQMCVYLVIAYLLSKTPLFAPLMQVTVRLPGKLVCYLVFSGFCVMGTYLGFQIEGAIANTRAIGAVLGGLPYLGGFSVGRSSDWRSALQGVCTAIRSVVLPTRPVRCRRLSKA